MGQDASAKRESLWRSRLQRFKSSGLTVTRFCEIERVSMPSFYQWRKRLGISAVKTPLPKFIPVRIAQSSAIEIHLPNGARISVPPGEVDSLRVAIEVAGQLSSATRGEAEAC